MGWNGYESKVDKFIPGNYIDFYAAFSDARFRRSFNSITWYMVIIWPQNMKII